MQFRPGSILSQMTKHNIAPDVNQEAVVRADHAGEAEKEVASQSSSRTLTEAKSTTPPRRRMDPFGVFWKMIIRPPRAEYGLDELGPRAFRIPGSDGSYCREDVQLISERGERLECSYFRSFSMKLKEPPRQKPCVVYLHGNCSSRLEALDVLDELLPRGISVFCFDFAGSGHSEGQYVTLGHNEEQDLRVVLDHLRGSEGVGPIALWGRSMGAATSIFRAAKDHTIAACVLDSPFSSLPDVARELAQSTKLKMPEMMVGAMLKRIRTEVKARASVDIEELKPIEFAPRATAPALFAVAKDDEFVKAHHTYALHDAWGGEVRELVTLGGGHNSARPREFHVHAAEFLQEQLTRLEQKPAPLEPQVQVECQFSDTSSTRSTRAPSRMNSQELPAPAAPEASLQPPPRQAPHKPRAVAPASRTLELPVTCRAALARAGLGSCLDGCLVGITAAAAPGGA